MLFLFFQIPFHILSAGMLFFFPTQDKQPFPLDKIHNFIFKYCIYFMFLLFFSICPEYNKNRNARKSRGRRNKSWPKSKMSPLQTFYQVLRSMRNIVFISKLQRPEKWAKGIKLESVKLFSFCLDKNDSVSQSNTISSSTEDRMTLVLRHSQWRLCATESMWPDNHPMPVTAAVP